MLNADLSIHTSNFLGTNLFQYCGNNSVNYTDLTGEWFGFDDILTGPVDEIIIIGGLSILSICGIGWAQSVQADILDGLTSLCNNTTTTLTNIWSDITINLAKPSKKSGKERADDKPSWVNKGLIDSNLSAQENAKNILDAKYGKGNCKREQHLNIIKSSNGLLVHYQVMQLYLNYQKQSHLIPRIKECLVITLLL